MHTEEDEFAAGFCLENMTGMLALCVDKRTPCCFTQSSVTYDWVQTYGLNSPPLCFLDGTDEQGDHGQPGEGCGHPHPAGLNRQGGA